jgi:hypothetical protein
MKEGMNAPHKSINATKGLEEEGPAVIPPFLPLANENKSPGHVSWRRKKSILGHS